MLLMQAFLLLAILSGFFARPKIGVLNKNSLGYRKIFFDFFGKNAVLIAWMSSIFISLMTLFYSNIVGYLPCYLCWWQRIFLFPQVFILGIAYFRKDIKAFDYSIVLLFVGSLFSFYNNFIYYFRGSSGPCDASGVSCGVRYVYELGGYVSIPMMALTSFVFLICVLLIGKKYAEGKAKTP